MDDTKMNVNQDALGSIGMLFIGAISWFWVRSVNVEKEESNKRFEQYKHSNEHRLEELTSDVEKLREMMQSTRETYLTRSDFQTAINRIINQLERIESTIHSRQTVSECDAIHRRMS